MSAPQTNVEKQTKRHRPSLWGIAAVCGFAAILFLGYLAVVAEKGSPENDETGATAVTPSQ